MELHLDEAYDGVQQTDKRALMRREIATAVTLTGDDEHGDPLDQRMGQVECAGRVRQDRRPTRHLR